MRLPPREARNLAPGRLGAPPGGHYGSPARSWLIGAANRPGKRGPGSQNAAVERREAGILRQGCDTPRKRVPEESPAGAKAPGAARRSTPRVFFRGNSPPRRGGRPKPGRNAPRDGRIHADRPTIQRSQRTTPHSTPQAARPARWRSREISDCLELFRSCRKAHCQRAGRCRGEPVACVRAGLEHAPDRSANGRARSKKRSRTLRLSRELFSWVGGLQAARRG